MCDESADGGNGYRVAGNADVEGCGEFFDVRFFTGAQGACIVAVQLVVDFAFRCDVARGKGAQAGAFAGVAFGCAALQHAAEHFEEDGHAFLVNDGGIELAVVIAGVGEKVAFSPVAFAVAQNHLGSCQLFPIGQGDGYGWVVFYCDFECGDDVGRRPEAFFQAGCYAVHNPGIQPEACHLQKRFVVDCEYVYGLSEPCLHGFEGNVEAARADAQFAGEDVHGAAGQDAEGGLGAGQSRCGVHQRAIAACRRNNGFPRFCQGSGFVRQVFRAFGRHQVEGAAVAIEPPLQPGAEKAAGFRVDKQGNGYLHGGRLGLKGG